MRIVHQLAIGLACIGLIVLALPSRAQADDRNEEAFLTFSAPVALPGVVLPAGTYMFTVADPDGDHMLVRVRSRNGIVCYGTFLTVPTSPEQGDDAPAITLEKERATAPEAIKTWSYPGLEAHEFIYPRQRSSY